MAQSTRLSKSSIRIFLTKFKIQAMHSNFVSYKRYWFHPKGGLKVEPLRCGTVTFFIIIIIKHIFTG